MTGTCSELPTGLVEEENARNGIEDHKDGPLRVAYRLAVSVQDSFCTLPRS